MKVLKRIPKDLIFIVMDYNFIFNGSFLGEWEDKGNGHICLHHLINIKECLYIIDYGAIRIQIRDKTNNTISDIDMEEVLKQRPYSVAFNEPYLYVSGNVKDIKILNLSDLQVMHTIPSQGESVLRIYKSQLYAFCREQFLIDVYTINGGKVRQIKLDESYYWRGHDCILGESFVVDNDSVYTFMRDYAGIVISSIDGYYITTWYGPGLCTMFRTLSYITEIGGYIFVGAEKQVLQIDKKGTLVKKWEGKHILSVVSCICYFNGKIFVSDSNNCKLIVLE